MKDIRLKFSKKKDMIYISHLDLMRLLQRVFRRAGIKMEYTQGFNPQPKMSFATALALGTESDSEYMDIELAEDIEIDELIERLNENLPDGIEMLGGVEKTDKASIMSLIEWGTYEVEADLKKDYTEEEIQKEIDKFLQLDEIIDIKEKKKKKKIIRREVNIRDLIKNLELISAEDGEVKFFMFLKTGSNGNLKPETVIKKIEEYTDLEMETDYPRVYRKELLIEENNKIVNII